MESGTVLGHINRLAGKEGIAQGLNSDRAGKRQEGIERLGVELLLREVEQHVVELC